MEEYILNSIDDMDSLFLRIREHLEKGSVKVSIKKDTKQRTNTQNGSLHLYCSNMAILMNDAGITQKKLVTAFKEGFELPVSDYMIKDIFREVGKAMYKKESTSDLTTIEISGVYLVVNQRFGEVTGVETAWPNRFGV